LTQNNSIVGIKMWMEGIFNGGMWAILDSPGLVTKKADREYLLERTNESARTCLDYLLRGSPGNWQPVQVYAWNNGNLWPESTINQANQTVIYTNWGGWWYQQMFQRLAKQGVAKAITFSDGRANTKDTDANFYSLRREIP